MANKYPLVGICIPVKNGAKTIAETIKSLIRQDYPNFELLIIDNNSEDNTKIIIEELLSNTTIKYTYIINQLNGAAESNWNFLLSHLPEHINYFALFHADDIYSSNIISKEFNILKKANVGAVFTQSNLIDDLGNDVTNKYNHHTKLPSELANYATFDYETLLYYTFKYHNLIRTPSFFFDKKILNLHEKHFDLKFKTSADLDFWLRIAKNNKIAILNESLFQYRISKNQGSYKLLHNRVELGDYFQVMDSHLIFYKNSSDVINWYEAHKSIELIFCAINLVKLNNKKKAKLFLNRATAITNINKIIQIRNGLKVYLFGIVFRISLLFKLENLFIKIIKY